VSECGGKREENSKLFGLWLSWKHKAKRTNKKDQKNQRSKKNCQNGLRTGKLSKNGKMERGGGLRGRKKEEKKRKGKEKAMRLLIG